MQLAISFLVSSWKLERLDQRSKPNLSVWSRFLTTHNQEHRQFHFRNDLLILLSGSLAVFADVNLLFIPHILEQKDFLLAARFPLGFFSVTAIFKLATRILSPVRSNAFSVQSTRFRLTFFLCHADIS